MSSWFFYICGFLLLACKLAFSENTAVLSKEALFLRSDYHLDIAYFYDAILQGSFCSTALYIHLFIKESNWKSN